MGGHNYRMTKAMRAVLAAVVDAPETAPAWGLSICDSTGLGSSAVYSALDKLMKAGLIRDKWEDPPPEGRPRRRYYYGCFRRSWYRANRLLGPAAEAS
jgi:DNA-binding PadR family transcriptional regulator